MEQHKLIRFRVQNFRSINDSGWINADNITCLVGVNEAGKTNLLLPLWKLKPANKEEIIPLNDYPRKRYADYKSTEGKEIFISAEFSLSKEIANEISKLSLWTSDFLKTVIVHRKYNKSYEIEFPNSKLEFYKSGDFIELLNSYNETIERINEETHNEYKKELIKIINDSIAKSKKSEVVKLDLITDFKTKTDQLSKPENLDKQIHAKLTEIAKKIDLILDNFDNDALISNAEIEKLIISYIPSFIYFSDYGKLDAEIYLPTVVSSIAQLNQPQINEKLRAKARTLKVLFEFVNLEPQEIVKLGVENQQNRTEQIIEIETKQKKERGVLLHSASSILTDKFREWWKQGEYNFRFEADGNYFRIWVNDDKREEWIELENRSQGLQWFFSFLLVFLVESKDAHSDCILLLDEPGITLHPIAQSNLIEYFKSLSDENQLIYTTHSPFLVDAENLGQVKAVYVDDKGFTAVSDDLRKGVKNTENSIYPVNAAIGLTVSDTLLIGCQPIIVEGTSDQIYLQIIKNILIGKKKINPSKELVFIPTGGVRGMSSTINVVVGRDAKLPYVILDADKHGKDKLNALKQEIYATEPEKLISLKEILNRDYVEVEDLMPYEIIASEFAKMTIRVDEDFDEIYTKDKPIIQQIETFAKNKNIVLENGYKVTLAKNVQRKTKNIPRLLDEETIKIWKTLFDKIIEKQVD